MQLLTMVAVAAIAFLTTWAAVRLWIRFSLRVKILDVPTHRSSHTTVTPRGGGTGIVATVLVFLLAAATLSGNIHDAVSVIWVASLGFLIALTGFVDDVRSLSSVFRLGVQLVVSCAVIATLGAFPAVTLPFVGPIALPPAAGGILTIIWIVGMTNVYNFMDGIDGIAGGQAVVAGLAWAGFGFHLSIPLILWFGLIVAASCAGFLRLNWSPAKVFMGDVGSAFLGFLFSVLPILAAKTGESAGWSQTLVGATPFFGVMVVWPFIGDGVFTFVRRIKHGENVLEAHRSHLYQRLSITGWSHSAVSSLYIAWAVASALFGAVYLFDHDYSRLTAAVATALLVVGMFLFVKLREQTGIEMRNLSKTVPK